MFEAVAVIARRDDFVLRKRQASTNTPGQPDTHPREVKRSKAVGHRVLKQESTRGSAKGNSTKQRYKKLTTLPRYPYVLLDSRGHVDVELNRFAEACLVYLTVTFGIQFKLFSWLEEEKD
jgi:hypothetical protein